MRFALEKVAEAIGAAAPEKAAMASGWGVDSRTIEAGDVFFALYGPNHDGHRFVREVFQKGAVAAVVDQPVEASGVLLRVTDTLQGLHQLAAWARRQWGGQVVAVTGSAGKTTTKEIISRFLETELPVAKSAGNLNNHVGLPLSILRTPDDARVAVLEIGMNHAGEIRGLAQIAQPTVGVVTNVGYAHTEFFDSIEDIALAKRELIEALPGDGVAVLNADDPLVTQFREAHTGPVVTFGLSPAADVHPEEVEYSLDGFRLRLGKSVWIESRLMGKHGVLNLLAGVAVAQVFGIAPERLREAAHAISAGAMRGERFIHDGITVLDDCYNSNPDAARLMLDLLRVTPARRRIAVLGEMLELGRRSESLHRDVGRYVAACGINVLIGIRGAARHMVVEAANAGMTDSAAYFFEDPVEAGDFARRITKHGDAVLFKGSRGTKVERALESFLK
jgi:UDP-N-acetylmuramoyl-tripeptide--D-alanyl-D-alanine ligase